MKLSLSKTKWTFAGIAGLTYVYLFLNSPVLTVPASAQGVSAQDINAQNTVQALPVSWRSHKQSEASTSSMTEVSPSLPSQGATDFLVNSDYVLGAGDRLIISFLNVPEYDGERSISIDGSLVLPLIGKLPVAGLTLNNATQAIGSAYASYLRTPLVTVDLIAPRPIKIGISGEVNKPGAYEVPLTGSGGSLAAVQWPTVVEAVRLAGGITNQADIRAVEIRRASTTTGAGETIRLNLWEILQTGSVQNDITLRSGDAINIPTTTGLSPEELTQLSAANFSPETIRVTVVGEVPGPGIQEIEPNAPLNQALLAAGGFDPRRANTNTVDLIRLNPDGTVSQREISVSFDQGINEETNPSLQANDVVVVGRSGRAAFSDNAESLLGPLGTLFSPFRLIQDLFDD